MKQINIFYWTSTGLISAFMLFSAIPNILMVPESIVFMNQLGYPNYFIPFIGIAKALGVIAILIPANFPRVKEWAYAGLFFDLIGAFYSVVATSGFDASSMFIVLPIGVLALSYVMHHKKQLKNIS